MIILNKHKNNKVNCCGLDSSGSRYRPAAGWCAKVDEFFVL